MPKAIALYSGGLDSILAILAVKKQGVEVIGLKFLTGFVSKLKEEDYVTAEKFGFKIEQIDIREKFIEILRHPLHGYGKNLNPCIDCRIFMLKEAKKIMKKYEAEFIITGEVLGQRIMTQKYEIMRLIEKEAGLESLILRPLSAKLLPPSLPEIKGLVKRELLYDFQGRSRKPQIKLAMDYCIQKIPQPAGGCLLTDPLFCKKVNDLIMNNELSVKNVELLKLGRHFRISEKCKAIAGRNEEENETLLKNTEGVFLYPEDFKGPVVLLIGEFSEKEIQIAASICVYYSKRKNSDVIIKKGINEDKKIFNAISEQEIVKYRI